MAELKTCKFCGQSGLHWEVKDGQPPLLYTKSGEQHHLFTTLSNGEQRMNGCVGEKKRPELVEDLLEDPMFSTKAKEDLKPQPVSGMSEMEFNAIRQLAQNAHALSLDMTRTAMELTGRQGIVEEQFKNLDEKWTRIAESTRKIEIAFSDGTSFKFTESTHYMMPKLMRLLARGHSVYLRGPAGSGKTMGVAQAAKARGQRFYLMSIGPLTGKADLFGYMPLGGGPYVRTVVRDAVEFGGVLLLDEVDSGNAGLNTMLNILTEKNNRIVSFPDGDLEKHKDFRVIATANTYGNGADRTYIGRNQQDGAFLDRFTVLNWDYDWDFVTALSGNADWTSKVQAWFDSASRQKIPVVIGPRAAIEGADLIRAGFDEDEVAEMRVWARVSVDDKRKIVNGIPVETNWAKESNEKRAERLRLASSVKVVLTDWIGQQTKRTFESEQGKLGAIKFLRENAQCGLAEAKAWVEYHIEKMND